MAKGSNSGFKISIGLRYDELNQDFVDVGQTISENIQKLNRQNNLIDLKSRISLVGVNDEARQLDILSQKLQKQVEIQRNKVLLYEDAANQANKAYGTESKNAQDAVYAYQKQRLELKQLCQQLSQVADRQKQLSQSQPKSNSLLAGYTSLKGNISGNINTLATAFNGLKTASQSADGAITKSLEIIGSIPHPVGKAVAALAAIPLVIQGVENSLLSLAKPGIAAGDALYVMSRGMQISAKNMSELKMIAGVTGIDINEVNSSLRRLSASITKADEKGNLASRTLQKYGASIKDANGNVKQGTALVSELAKAFANAQALGKGAEFRDAVGGRFWSAGFVTFLEDYKGNVKAASEVVRNGLANPRLAHDVQGAINKMDQQANQLGSTFQSALMPVAENLVPNITKRLGELTQVVNDNADGIKAVASAVASVAGTIGTVTTKTIELGVAAVGAIGKVFSADTQADYFIERYKKEGKDFVNDIKSGKELFELELKRELPTRRAAIESNQHEYNRALAKYEKIYADIQARLAAIDKKRKSNEEKVVSESGYTEEELKASADRIEKYSDELSKIKLDLKFGDNNYQKSLAELEQWYKEAIRIAGTNWAERIQIEETYKAKLEKLRQEPAKNAENLNKETANIEFERTHTAFEKQIRDIERWKDAQLKKANTAKEVSAIIANAAAKEAKAFEQEMDKIRGKVQSLQEKIFEQEHSEKANQLLKIQKEAYEYMEQGLPIKDIARWYGNELKKNGFDPFNVPDLYQNIIAKTNKSMAGNYGQEPKYPQQPDKISAPDATKPYQEIAKNFNDKLSAPLQSVSDSVKIFTASVGNVGGLFKNVSDSAMLLANTFINAANKISEFQISPNNATDKNQVPTKDVQPAKINDNTTEKPKNAAQNFSGNNSSANNVTASLSKEFGAITKQLTDITRYVGAIAQDANKKSDAKKTINVTVQPPTITLSLNGSYVLTQQMVNNMQNDITTEVYNTLTSAVRDGINDINL